MPLLVDPVLTPDRLSTVEQPTLTAGAISLRPWRTGDADALVAVYAEPEIQRWHVRSMTHTEAEEWIEAAGRSWSEGVGASWAVEHEGVFAGRMTFTLQPTFGQAAAAYWVRGRSRGHGIAPCALTAASEWAFGIGLHRVELEHSTANPASCRVAVKAGFDPEGTRRSSVLHADGWHDMHVHARIAGVRISDVRGSDVRVDGG